MKVIIIIFLFYFIENTIPDYSEIKRDEILNFTLENFNSSFYAYLNCSNDYESNEYNYTLEHYLIIEQNIQFKSMILSNESDFPDEFEFNKYSNYSETYYMDIDTEKNIFLGSYPKCKKEEINNSIIYFVFYYNEDYNQDFDENKQFIVKRLHFNQYLTNDNQGILNIELKANEINLYKMPIEIRRNNDYVLFINYPFSSLFFKNLFGTNLTKYMSNLNLYFFSLHFYRKQYTRGDIYELYFIIYNPYNYNKYFNLEHKIDASLREDALQFYSLNIDYFKQKDSLYMKHCAVTCIFDNEPGLFQINSLSSHYLFIDNIEDIKNLTDLYNIRHYKYISEGILYSPNKTFILLNINTYNNNIFLKISKIALEEKGSQINDISFTYFKISQNNSLTFTQKNSNQSFIIKLLSNNNGTININNKNYFFNQNELKIFEPKESITIVAIDNNFDFGIKLKIPDELIDYGEIGKDYISTNNSNYKFVIYKIDTKNNSVIQMDLKYEKENVKFYSFEITSNLNEIQKRGICSHYIQYFDLLPYKKDDSNDWYLFFYLEKLTNYNITIQTSYTKPIPPSYEGIFNSINKNTVYINFCYTYSYEFFYNVPYNDFIRIGHLSYGSSRGGGQNTPFYLFIECKPYEYIIIINSVGYISYQRFNDIQDFFGFNVEDIPLKSFTCYPIDFNHIRINMSHIFSNSSEINYTLAISPNNNNQNKELFDPLYNIVYNYFIDKTNLNKAKDIEIYHFSLKDIKENIQENQSFYYIDLPMPTNFYPYGSNKPFKYLLMGVTGPIYKIPKIYSTLYLDTTICNDNCSECDYLGNETDQKCTSCYKNSKYKYLINDDDYAQNCVEECPEELTLDEEKYQCYKRNYTLAIVLGIFGLIILIIVVIIVYIKFIKSRKKKDEKNEEQILLKDFDSGANN